MQIIKIRASSGATHTTYVVSFVFNIVYVPTLQLLHSTQSTKPPSLPGPSSLKQKAHMPLDQLCFIPLLWIAKWQVFFSFGDFVFFSWKRNAVVSLQAYSKGRFWFLDIDDHCQPQQVLLPLILRNERDGELREWRRYSAHFEWLLLVLYPYCYVKNGKKKSLNTRRKTEECTLDKKQSK